MAIPDDRLSTTLVAAHFLAPDNLETGLLVVYELGGTDLNDPGDGLQVQTWTLRYFPTSGDMVIVSPTTSPVTLFTRSDITEIDLAFDQNMNPFVCFVESGVAKFWWFDTAIPGTTFTSLGAGVLTPRCCLDDKRATQDGFSDIILCSVESGKLVKRHQRDRYTAVITLMDPFIDPVFGLPAVLIKVGMNKKNRLQWKGDLANPIDWCNFVNAA